MDLGNFAFIQIRLPDTYHSIVKLYSTKIFPDRLYFQPKAIHFFKQFLNFENGLSSSNHQTPIESW